MYFDASLCLVSVAARCLGTSAQQVIRASQDGLPEMPACSFKPAPFQVWLVQLWKRDNFSNNYDNDNFQCEYDHAKQNIVILSKAAIYIGERFI